MKSRNSRALLTTFALSTFSLPITGAFAQGCILTRNVAPVVGAQVSPYLRPGDLQINTSMRIFNTADEFEGNTIRTSLMTTDTSVHEGIQFFDIQGTYGISKQASITFDAPVILNGHFSTVLAGTRYTQTSHGLFDTMLVGRYWLFDTSKHSDQNISLGVGVRMPTGNSNATSLYPNSNGQNFSQVADFVAIQTGSGAWGIPVSLEAFKQFRYLSAFGSGNYLFSLRSQNNTLSLSAAINPAGPSAVPANERYNSTPDSYRAYAGVGAPVPVKGLKRASVLLASRIEGVPINNVFGATSGFRQPGYYVTVEPGFNYETRRALYSVTMPLRVYQMVWPSEGYARASDFAPDMVEFGINFKLGSIFKRSE
jgi:hypothetical protein